MHILPSQKPKPEKKAKSSLAFDANILGIPNNLDTCLTQRHVFFLIPIPNSSKRQTTDVSSLSILFLRPEDQALLIEAPKDNCCNVAKSYLLLHQRLVREGEENMVVKNAAVDFERPQLMLSPVARDDGREKKFGCRIV